MEKTLIDIIHAYAGPAKDLLTFNSLIVAAIAAMTGVGAFLFGRQKKVEPRQAPPPPVVGTRDSEGLARVIEARIASLDAPPKTNETSRSLEQSVAFASENRILLQPSRLQAEIFPDELDVVIWKPGQILQMAIVTSMRSTRFRRTVLPPAFSHLSGARGLLSSGLGICRVRALCWGGSGPPVMDFS